MSNGEGDIRVKIVSVGGNIYLISVNNWLKLVIFGIILRKSNFSVYKF